MFGTLLNQNRFLIYSSPHLDERESMTSTILHTGNGEAARLRNLIIQQRTGRTKI